MNQHALATTSTYTDDQIAMLTDAMAGLSSSPKQLSSKYFYDEEGSRIFDEICELPEYYPTRTETEIMTACGDEIAAALGEDVMLVEYGSGSSIKTRILLDRIENLAAYVPVDISGDYLHQVADDLRDDFPHINVLPVAADFTQAFSLPRQPKPNERVVAYFPGSTIGNFTTRDAERILSQMADLAGADGGVLIGVDLLKARNLLLDAYNDASGVTARFNLNLLHRLNNELGSDFAVDQFRHQAIFNEDESRIEMHLFSKKDQVACLDGVRFHFKKDESILTEYSHKYTPEAFESLADRAGLVPRQVWTDKNDLFSVQLLTPADGTSSS